MIVSGTPFLQTFNVISFIAELMTIPSGCCVSWIFVPEMGLVHSIRLIRELKNPRASLELPLSSFNFGSNIAN